MSKKQPSAQQTPPETDWLTLQAAITATGISRTSLFDLRKAGELQPGKHWLFSHGRQRSPILWNVQAIRDWQMAETLAAVQQADATARPGTYSDLPGDEE
jgi:hypothetical protein